MVVTIVCLTHAIKPSVIPRVRGGVERGVTHGVAAVVVAKVHARCRAAHLLTSHQLITKLIAACIMRGSQVHPALACHTHTHITMIKSHEQQIHPSIGMRQLTI